MGCCGYVYFILAHFVTVRSMHCADKTKADEMVAKIATEDKMFAILGLKYVVLMASQFKSL